MAAEFLEAQIKHDLAADATAMEEGARPEDGVCSLRGVDVQRILAQEFGVLRSLAAVYFLLHRLGYSYLRPRPRHRKFDAQAQAEFQEQLPEELRRIATAHPGKRLLVFFQDESRFGQQGTTTNVWARKGSRPAAVRQTEGRQKLSCAAIMRFSCLPMTSAVAHRFV